MTPPRPGNPLRFPLMATALTAALLLAAWAAGPSPSAPAPAPRDTPPRLTEAEARKVSANNLKQLALAIVAYADANRGRLPTAALYDAKDAKGKALLSWRVAILPYLEQDKLYKQFHLDEPWDSPHNKKLLSKRPQVFAPVRGKTKEPYATYYQVFVGPETLFRGRAPAFYPASITDGTSNTFLVAEAGEAVPWTAPRDIDYDSKKPVPKLGGLFGGDFQVACADGAVRSYKKGKPSDATLRLAITPSDGNVLGDDF